MSAIVENNIKFSIKQEAYQLLGQLNEQNTIVVVKFMKKLLDNNSLHREQNSSSKKMAAFKRLMELREEIAATNPPSMDEIRKEAIEEKYGYNLDLKRNDI